MIAFITSLDTTIEQMLYAARDPSVVKVFAWITELGSVMVIIVITVIAAIALLRSGRIEYIWGLLVSLVGSETLTYILKYTVQRTRPSFPAVIENGYAFPSGHATAAMALYGFLVYVIWKTTVSKQYRTLWISLLACTILAVGISRVYLGVHFASDVIASYLIGYVFVWLGIAVVKWFEKHS